VVVVVVEVPGAGAGITTAGAGLTVVVVRSVVLALRPESSSTQPATKPAVARKAMTVTERKPDLVSLMA
jgi:hypothetical protein